MRCHVIILPTRYLENIRERNQQQNGKELSREQQNHYKYTSFNLILKLNILISKLFNFIFFIQTPKNGEPVAIRYGIAVQTVKKFDAGSNRKAAAAPVNARKLEEGTEPAEVRLMIQKARLGKKMSQAELAKQINERTQVVQEYENGKAVLNQAVLGKIEKVLGVKLRGKPAKWVYIGLM